MLVKKFTAGSFASNCYVLSIRGRRDAIIIDPGAEESALLEYTGKNGLSLKYIIATHGHIDHTGAIAALAEALSPPPLVCIHVLDAAMLEDPEACLADMSGMPFRPVRPDILLEDGSVIQAGALRLETVHTPGHTPGGISLLGDGVLFTGDTLFAGGVGRTDFPGGSTEKLSESINNRILSLGGGTRVFPGHGPETTVGSEKLSVREWI